jgi:Flp pilus assembly protein TadG
MLKLMKTKLAARRCQTACALGRLLRQQDGAAAVEFSLVAAPFLALLFAIMETALVFFSGQALETAVADSARLIMTGQAQSQGLTQATFKNAVCA